MLQYYNIFANNAENVKINIVISTQLSICRCHFYFRSYPESTILKINHNPPLPPPPPVWLIILSSFFYIFKSIFRENRGRLYIGTLIEKCGLGTECSPSSYREQIYRIIIFSVLFGYPTLPPSLALQGFSCFQATCGIWWQRRWSFFPSFLNFSWQIKSVLYTF